MKPIGFVAAGNPNGPRAGADATADREIASPAASTKPNGGDAFTSSVATAEDSDSTQVLGWSAAAEFARANPNQLDDSGVAFTLVANPFGPQGGLFDRMADSGIASTFLSNDIEPFNSNFGSYYHQLTESPAIPMADIFNQIARAFPPSGGPVSHLSPNDAVTISAEAQAAADALDPPG